MEIRYSIKDAIPFGASPVLPEVLADFPRLSLGDPLRRPSVPLVRDGGARARRAPVDHAAWSGLPYKRGKPCNHRPPAPVAAPSKKASYLAPRVRRGGARTHRAPSQLPYLAARTHAGAARAKHRYLRHAATSSSRPGVRGGTSALWRRGTASRVVSCLY